MEIRQLEYFINVGENLNFTETAKQLYVAQSAVSYQIANLEKELGVKLFLRDKHSVQLTSAGKILLKEARSIINKCYEAISKTQQAAAGVLGTLKIATLGMSVINFFPDLLKQFRMTYPNINIDFEIMNAEQITEALELGNIDIGFIRPISIQNNPNLIWNKVYTDQVCVIMRFDHPMANLAYINFSDLMNELFVSVNRQQSASIFDVLIKLSSNRGFSPNIVCTPHHVESVVCLVEAGFGISVLPSCFVKLISPDLRCVPIEGNDAYIDLAVGWNKNSSNQSIPLFINELEKSYKEV